MNLLQNRLKPSEFIRTVWSAQPEPGTTLNDMLQPEYWAHVSKTLKQGDRIEVTDAGNAWFAELFVRSASANDAKVVVLRSQVFDTPAPKADDGQPFEVKHRGGAGWSVIRKSDKTVVFERGATRDEAEAALAKLDAENLG